VVLTWGGLQATQVRRTLEEGKEPVFIDDAEYRLEFEVAGKPQLISKDASRSGALIFQYMVEHRSGVRLPPKYLKVGDVILEPLYLVSAGQNKKIELFPAGHELTEGDLNYILNRDYRQFYDASGAQIYPDSFKIGDPLDVYSMGYDDFGQLSFEESGLQTMSGKVIIPNGTVLNASHLAMLRNGTPFPVKVRQKIDLELESYLRVDWPDRYTPAQNTYWVFRDGVAMPILLKSYQIQPGDKPLANIVNLEREVICEKNQPFTLKGPHNSIEVLERFPDSRMLSMSGKLITSIDPISLDPNDSELVPGQLVLAPRNRGEFLRPYLIKGAEDLNELLSSGHLSLARGYGEKTGDSFPFLSYLTHYTIPLYKDCIAGCDALLDISNDVMKGSHHCENCKKTIDFRPYVYAEISGYAYAGAVWKEAPIHCSHCDLAFMRYRAHALCGEDGAFEYPGMALNVVYPTRLRSNRLAEGATLAADVTFYKNGKEVIFEKGALINDELRHELEKRATSPIYLEEPYAEKYEAAQCPRCFAWNHQPLETFSLKDELNVDQLRRGIATFPIPEGKFNKLELVTFGLDQAVEPTSGRSLAKVITFRKTVDPTGSSIWTKDAERWEYLPRYRYEKSMIKPVSLTGEAEKSGPINLLENF